MRLEPRKAGHAFRISYSPWPAVFLIRPSACADAPETRVVPEPGTVAAAFSHRGESGQPGKFQGLATRNPMLLFVFVGLLLLRLDDARLFELLFQLPPRNTG